MLTKGVQQKLKKIYYLLENLAKIFDGDQKKCYNGFSYFSRFWQPVIPTFKKHWNLDSNSSVSDIGCAKGFMMHNFAELIPCITVKGI